MRHVPLCHFDFWRENSNIQNFVEFSGILRNFAVYCGTFRIFEKFYGISHRLLRNIADFAELGCSLRSHPRFCIFFIQSKIFIKTDVSCLQTFS